MPTFEYLCCSCGHQWEEENKHVNADTSDCDKKLVTGCHGVGHRLISRSSFVVTGFSEKNGYSNNKTGQD